MSNPFWDYSVAVYGRDGVPRVCLELQDCCGLDVNVLLYGAWLAVLDWRLTKPHLADIDAGVEEWRSKVVQPLRSLRRELRSYPAAAAIREDIKAVELRVERQQQDIMYEIHRACGDQPAADQPLHENLALVAAFTCSGDASWRTPIEQICTLLGP